MASIALSQVAVHLRPEDNVAVAARNIPAGTELNGSADLFTANALVKLGHKIALVPIKKGEAVTKYGQIIGFTSKYISQRFHATDLLKQFPNVDGVVSITHKAGCAMQYDGPDHRQLDPRSP